MDEIFRIADCATVLRDGRLIDSRPISDYTLSSLIGDIMGRATRNLSEFVTDSTASEEVSLEVERLAGRGGGEISVKLHKGEVLGVAGLLGAGRSRLARMLFGLEPMAGGAIRIGGREYRSLTPQTAKDLGIALVPEDRRRQGLVLQHSIEANIELPILRRLGAVFIDTMTSRSTADRLIERLSIKTSSRQAPANSLSGGNQQKIVLAKWLATEPQILILDEPTAGIDIGSKGEVLRLVRDLAAEGKSIIFISSELTELLAVSDRIAIMSGGSIVEIFEKSELMQEAEEDAGAEHRLQVIVQQGGRHA
jgi:ribose transport system ATP-binding protein